MDEIMIQTEQVGKTVATVAGQLTILHGIDLKINAGESVALVGASGSGKSTLLGLLAGLDTVTSGTIRLAGRELTRLNEDERAVVRRELLGFVFQSFQLLPALTALENVALPLELKGVRSALKEAQELLRRCGLGSRLDHYPRQLSGGEQQRVAIARAFASHPRLLLADEPTGNLDTATGATIIDLLFELNREEATTLLLVTHDGALAERCQRRVVMVGGTIVSSGEAPL